MSLFKTERIQQLARATGSNTQQGKVQRCDFVVIGAGISGAQAAEVLTSAGKSVIVLEANDYAGGRIRSEPVTALPEAADVHWVKNDSRLKEAYVQHGATWLSADHSYALRWVKELGLSIYNQYADGLIMHGRTEGQYMRIDSMGQLYITYRLQIQSMLDEVARLIEQFHSLNQQLAKESNSPQLNQQYIAYLRKYDQVDMRSFFEKHFEDKHLLELIIDTIETEECVPCSELSLLHTISSDGYSLDNLKVYLGLASDVTDEMKIREGFEAIVDGILRKAQQYSKTTNILRLSQPVIEVNNDGPLVEVLTNKQRYICNKVVWSVPLATCNNVKITRLSQSKRLLFANQIQANAVKLFLIFKQPFWRTRFCGNAYFSCDFPFTELIEVSPPNLSCGILAFFLLADKINKWETKFGEGYTDKQVLKLKKQYALKVIADMFLAGDINSPELQDVIIAERSYRHNKYIRSCYQSISRIGSTAEIQSSDPKGADCKTRDQHNIVFIGSQLGDEYGTYVEGAIRYARKKMYQLLQRPDPWAQ